VLDKFSLFFASQSLDRAFSINEILGGFAGVRPLSPAAQAGRVDGAARAVHVLGDHGDLDCRNLKTGCDFSPNAPLSAAYRGYRAINRAEPSVCLR